MFITGYFFNNINFLEVDEPGRESTGVDAAYKFLKLAKAYFVFVKEISQQNGSPFISEYICGCFYASDCLLVCLHDITIHFQVTCGQASAHLFLSKFLLVFGE